MIKVGLTGSIAMGKSFVAKKFQEHGFKLYDADQEVRNLLNNQFIKNKLSSIIPDAFDKEKLNKMKMAELIFNDHRLLIKTQLIIHLAVSKIRKEFIKSARLQNKSLLIFDIPLLYEKSLQNNFDYIILVTSPSYLQQKRALRRTGMSITKFKSILNKQMKDNKKRLLADYIIYTGLSKIQTKNSINYIANELKKYERNSN